MSRLCYEGVCLRYSKKDGYCLRCWKYKFPERFKREREAKRKSRRERIARLFILLRRKLRPSRAVSLELHVLTETNKAQFDFTNRLYPEMYVWMNE
jgi:hypothetical protein